MSRYRKHMHVKLFQSCPTLRDPMDCSSPGSSVQGILQARTLEWVAMPSFRGSSRPRGGTRITLCLLHWQASSLSLLLLFSRSDFLQPHVCQASLSFTISQSLLKRMSIESVMLSNHLVLCHPLLLLPSIFPSTGSFPMSQLFASVVRGLELQPQHQFL